MQDFPSQTFLNDVTDSLGEVAIKLVAVLIIAVLLLFLVRISVKRFVNSAIKRAQDRAPEIGRRAENTEDLSQIVMEQRTVQRSKAVGQIVRSVFSLLIWSVTAILFLSILGINVTPVLASAGVAGVAIGFGAQTLIKDFLAGIFIIFEDQYGIGDIVDLGPAVGTVEEVGLRITRLRDLGGVVWYVRNGEILRVANRSQGWTLAIVDVPVAYNEDLERVRQVVEKVGQEMLDDPQYFGQLLGTPTYAGVEQVSGDAVFLRIVAKTAPDQPIQMARIIREKLKMAFDQAGINVPVLARPYLPGSSQPQNPNQK
jgi:moderate conductance mechanosensitive channel